MNKEEIRKSLEDKMMVRLPDYDWQLISDKLDQSRAEERERIVKEIEKVRFGYEPPYVGDCYEEMKGEWRGIVKVLNELLTSLQDKPKCVCGYQDILDGAEVEIGGVCHRPKNPCYIIEPLKNK